MPPVTAPPLVNQKPSTAPIATIGILSPLSRYSKKPAPHKTTSDSTKWYMSALAVCTGTLLGFSEEHIGEPEQHQEGDPREGDPADGCLGCARAARGVAR